MGDLCSKLIYRDMWNVDQFGCPSPRVMISRSQPVIQASHWLIKHIHWSISAKHLTPINRCWLKATATFLPSNVIRNHLQQTLTARFTLITDYTDALANTPALDGGLRISWPILSSNSSSPLTVPPGSTVVSRSQWPTGTHSTFGELLSYNYWLWHSVHM
ncbi:hypothetical protein PSHT_04509 [Puccinia striiformis]|uniref:Uncharacterized protein n=1 Tax=Puccinia striiformis TaxID=27350 RepID=A0A2S4WCR6_9BASI|nr:hypothetical protein PSHT_04509 [Puccinia striiformis]